MATGIFFLSYIGGYTVRDNHLEILLKPRSLGPIHRDSNSVGQGWRHSSLSEDHNLKTNALENSLPGDTHENVSKY